MWQIFLLIALFIIGFAIIYIAADFFIDNLKDLCIIYDISPFIIGLIVLGIDPEETIASVVAAMNHLPYIAIGNVIGNSIISLTICLALPALFHRIGLKSISSFYFLILSISMFLILFGCIFTNGLFIVGIFSIILYVLYLLRSLKYLSKEKKLETLDIDLLIEEFEKEKEELGEKSKIRMFMIIIGSFFFIVIGGELLIFSAEQLISLTAIPESFFGFIIIAFVTNVEELTLVFKSIKKNSIEIGLGAMIGKVIWNLTLTFGLSVLITMNISLSLIFLLNWILLLIVIVIFTIMQKKESLSKLEGIILTVSFMVFIFLNIFFIGL